LTQKRCGGDEPDKTSTAETRHERHSRTSILMKL
jgi:hypothetical protein